MSAGLTQFFKLDRAPFVQGGQASSLFTSSQMLKVPLFLQQQLAMAQSASLLIGAKGLGKTTSWQAFAQDFDSPELQTIFFSKAVSQVRQLLLHLNSLLGLAAYEDDKQLFKQIEAALQNRSQALILVFDNAQLFPPAVCQFIDSWLKRAKQKDYRLHFVFIFDRENDIASQAQIALQGLANEFEFLGLKRQEALMYLRQHCQQCGNKQLLSFDASDQIIKLAQGNFASLDKIARSAVAQAYTQKSEQVLAKHVGVKAERMLALQDKGVSAKSQVISLRTILLLLLLLLVVAAALYQFEQSSIDFEQPDETQAALIEPQVQTPKPVTAESASNLMEGLPALLSTLESNKQLALSAVSWRWQLGSVYGLDQQAACSRLALQGFQCVDFNADLKSLLALNLPALFKLRDKSLPAGEAQIRYAALLARQNNQFWLSIDGELERVSLTRLEQLWDGSFSVIWRQRFALADRLEVGDKDSSMAKVRTLLLRWSQLPEHKGKSEQRLKALVRTVDGNRYSQDDALLVQAFQRNYRLPMDGVIAPYMVQLLSQVIEIAPVSLSLTEPAQDLR